MSGARLLTLALAVCLSSSSVAVWGLELKSQEECLTLAQNLAKSIYGVEPDMWEIESDVRTFDLFYTFRCPELYIRVNARGGYVATVCLGSLLQDMNKNGYLSEEEALSVGKGYLEEVLGFIPEGVLSAKSLGPDLFPHWKIYLERYTSQGIFVDRLIEINIHGGNVISYACRDFPASDVTGLVGDPTITRKEAEQIARKELGSILRRLFDEPVKQELAFFHPVTRVQRWDELTPYYVEERLSEQRVLVWRVQFDNFEVLVDADNGDVLATYSAMMSHNPTREVLCISVILISALGIGVLLTKGLVKRLRAGSLHM